MNSTTMQAFLRRPRAFVSENPSSGQKEYVMNMKGVEKVKIFILTGVAVLIGFSLSGCNAVQRFHCGTMRALY